MYLNCDYCKDYLDKGHKSCDECGYAFGSDEMGYGVCKSNIPQFKYIIIFEDGQIFKAKDLTNEDFDSWNSGLFDIIRVSDQKVYRGDEEWVDPNIWSNE